MGMKSLFLIIFSLSFVRCGRHEKANNITILTCNNDTCKKELVDTLSEGSFTNVRKTTFGKNLYGQRKDNNEPHTLNKKLNTTKNFKKVSGSSIENIVKIQKVKVEAQNLSTNYSHINSDIKSGAGKIETEKNEYLRPSKTETHNFNNSLPHKTNASSKSEAVSTASSETLATSGIQIITEVYFTTTNSSLISGVWNKGLINLANKKNHIGICDCDLNINECDINCCCDQDCSTSMKNIFTSCKDTVNVNKSNFCYHKKVIGNNGIKMRKNLPDSWLFCIVKNNFNSSNVSNKQVNIIESGRHFQKTIFGRKIFRYTLYWSGLPEMKKTPYQFGDYLWAARDDILFPFRIPKENIDMDCSSVRSVHYLTDYSTLCLQSIPKNEAECKEAGHLSMEYYLRNVQILRSPHLINKSMKSDYYNKICTDETCVNISSFICPKDLGITYCYKASSKLVLWNGGVCKNVVSSIEYHIYHNGTDGVKEVRAYFTLIDTFNGTNFMFMQRIKLNFLWIETQVPVMTRSGNPGYIVGKPIMVGRKVFNSNETSTVKKEAIELAANASSWLSVFTSKAGICKSGTRQPVRFGEDVYYSCSVQLNNYKYLSNKCVDLQDDIFKLLIGDELSDIRLNNMFNKFVATFGNSKVEETGDWAHIILDVFPILSSQVGFTSLSNHFLCKNIITEAFIDIAYAMVGSSDKPQAKIVGVELRFGPPKKILFCKKVTCDRHLGETVLIATYIKHIDVTNKSVTGFAETPGFEVNLPHDFFYPFFSGTIISSRPNILLISFMFSILFCNDNMK